jgi:hypothetical protein
MIARTKSTVATLLLCTTAVSASAQSFDWTFTGVIDSVIQDALFDILDARFNNSPYGFSLNVQGPTNETDTNANANIGNYSFNSGGSSSLTFTIAGNPGTTPMTFSTHIFDLQIVNSTSNPGLEELSISATDVTFSDPLPSNSNSYTMSTANGKGFNLFLQSSDLNFLVGDGIPNLQPDVAMADQSASVSFSAEIDGQAGSNAFFMTGPVSVVPEPSEWATIALGLAGITIAIRRQRQKLLA